MTEELKPTHAFSIENNTQSDGIKREVTVERLSDGSTHIEIRTYCDGEGNLPLVTAMRLSKCGFSLLSHAMFEAAHNMEKYEVKND